MLPIGRPAAETDRTGRLWTSLILLRICQKGQRRSPGPTSTMLSGRSATGPCTPSVGLPGLMAVGRTCKAEYVYAVARDADKDVIMGQELDP